MQMHLLAEHISAYEHPGNYIGTHSTYINQSAMWLARSVDQLLLVHLSNSIGLFYSSFPMSVGLFSLAVYLNYSAYFLDLIQVCWLIMADLFIPVRCYTFAIVCKIALSCAAITAQELLSRHEGRSVDMVPYMKHYTLDVMLRCACSYESNCQTTGQVQCEQIPNPDIVLYIKYLHNYTLVSID